MDSEPFRTSRRTVIDALILHRALSRSGLAEVTGMSRPAITEIVQRLLATGMIEELPVIHEGQRRGRPSIQLSFAASHAYFLGVSITDRPSSMVLLNLRGEIVERCSVPFSAEPAGVAAAIRKGMAELLRTTGIQKKKVCRAGLALTGIVDQRTGNCRYSAALNWRDVPIGALVQRATGLATQVDNDVNAIAIGEKLFGRGAPFRHYSSVIMGRNIGCAHFIDNKLYRGHDGGAGEIGHITYDPAGPLCRCGRAGCLDVFAGGAALQQAADKAGLGTKSMHELEVLAANGSNLAISLLRRAGQALGLSVASLVQVNNPEAILFADVEGFGNGLFRTITRQSVENNILPRFLTNTQFIFESIDQSFLARGAASIALQQHLHAESDKSPAGAC